MLDFRESSAFAKNRFVWLPGNDWTKRAGKNLTIEWVICRMPLRIMFGHTTAWEKKRGPSNLPTRLLSNPFASCSHLSNCIVVLRWNIYDNVKYSSCEDKGYMCFIRVMHILMIILIIIRYSSMIRRRSPEWLNENHFLIPAVATKTIIWSPNKTFFYQVQHFIFMISDVRNVKLLWTDTEQILGFNWPVRKYSNKYNGVQMHFLATTHAPCFPKLYKNFSRHLSKKPVKSSTCQNSRQHVFIELEA